MKVIFRDMYDITVAKGLIDKVQFRMSEEEDYCSNEYARRVNSIAHALEFGTVIELDSYEMDILTDNHTSYTRKYEK